MTLSKDPRQVSLDSQACHKPALETTAGFHELLILPINLKEHLVDQLLKGMGNMASYLQLYLRGTGVPC